MLTRVKANFQQFGHVRHIKKSGRQSIIDAYKFNMLTVEDNPHLMKIVSIYNVTPSRVYKILKKAKYHLKNRTTS